MNDDDDLIAMMKKAASRDAAPSNLGARVIEQVEYRERLEQPLRLEHHRRWRRLLGGAVCVGVAASALLWLRLNDTGPGIVAEDASSPATGSVARSSRSATPPPVNPCRARVSADGKAPLVDDFEDGDDALLALDHRSGFWRWARETDAPGTAPALLPVPRPEATSTNRLALHVKGGQLYDWGATVQVSFRPPCYDATRYSGLALSARGPGRIYVSLREVGVIPSVEGGTCEGDCYNSHVSKLELTADFRTYQVSWADLRQRGIDRPPLDASQLHSIAFVIRPEDTPYDVWIDDVSFVSSER